MDTSGDTAACLLLRHARLKQERANRICEERTHFIALNDL